MSLEQVLQDVVAERRRQDAKWGEQNHNGRMWLCILAEEVGEVAHELYFSESSDALRAEWVQVAAVAVAAIESLDRARARRAEHADAQ